MKKSPKPMRKNSRTQRPRRSGVPQNKSNSAPASPTSGPSGRETILMAAVGMSPAILTETIWALANSESPVLPSRVIVLTTTQGRDCVSQLFKESPQLEGRSPWDSLRQALEDRGHDLAEKLRFGSTGDDVRVITAPDPRTHRSVELPDIRNLEDNEAAANFLLDQVRGIVENPDTDLIVSLAGGRKTMGALLYACMTLAGRETDRLTHVLVSEPYETLRNFWFPAQPGGPVKDRDGRAHDPANALLDLAEVPFVPLRNLFVRELGRRAGTFSRLMEQCRENIRTRAGENIRLEIESARPEIRVNGEILRLAPREHLVMMLLARRAKDGGSPLPSYQHAVEHLNELRNTLISQAPVGNLGDWRHRDMLTFKFDDDQDVRRAVSELGRKIRALGGDAATFSACLPERGRFSLAVTPSLIFLK